MSNDVLDSDGFFETREGYEAMLTPDAIFVRDEKDEDGPFTWYRRDNGWLLNKKRYL